MGNTGRRQERRELGLEMESWAWGLATSGPLASVCPARSSEAEREPEPMSID
jgi:hypothetical protein